MKAIRANQVMVRKNNLRASFLKPSKYNRIDLPKIRKPMTEAEITSSNKTATPLKALSVSPKILLPLDINIETKEI